VAPTAAFSSTCSFFTCDFADLSTDTDGSIVAWTWDFGDGSTSTEQNPGHVYIPTAAAIFFTVILTVTDDDGATDSISLVVNVVF